MSAKNKITHRLSVGLTDEEWAMMEPALKVECALWESNCYSEINRNQSRSRLLRVAMYAVCREIIRTGAKYPWACDLREETAQETQDRVDGKIPVNIKTVLTAIAWQMPPRN